MNQADAQNTLATRIKYARTIQALLYYVIRLTCHTNGILIRYLDFNRVGLLVTNSEYGSNRLVKPDGHI